jgi:hypothetical protein
MHTFVLIFLGLAAWFAVLLALGSFVGELLSECSAPATADSEPDPLIDMRKAA